MNRAKGKTCKQCGNDEWYEHKAGLVCAPCKREKNRSWYASNPGKNAEYARRWAQKNRARVRESHLLRTYGLTQEDYDHMLESQGGVCAICKRTSTRNLAVDHDRSCCSGDKSCGKCVRALLCPRCNTCLGAINDNLEVLESMRRYLLQHGASWLEEKVLG